MKDVRGKWLLTTGIVLFVAVLSALLTVRGRPPTPPKPAAKTAVPQPAALEISLQGQVQAKTAVKIMIPLILFIFPGVFIVLVGPAALQIANTMMSGK